MMGAVAQSGIPAKYPLAVNSPLDRAYLRPLQEPLYDTEAVTTASTTASLVFYQRPISQNMATTAVAVPKTEAETNMNQSAMLDYPREFSILGFNVCLDSTCTLQNAALLYRRAWFAFTFSGRRPYLQIPINRIPQGIGISGGVATALAGGASVAMNATTMGLPHIANYYKFNLGRAALKIKPGEAFNVRINWPAPPTLIAGTNYGVAPADTLIFVNSFMVGLNWSPL
jgi:hypothetical protein